ncbi:MAG: enoyl-CoA hydratase/isomerase family protein, partial [Fidelibacterota bacterium]
IAAVNGFALGGGCEIALACHLRIASRNAQFAQPEVHLGIIPGWGGTQRLPRLIGAGLATEWIVTGEMTSADEARRIGLVNDVVEIDQLMPRARKLATSILRNGPQAVRSALDCIRSGYHLPMEEALKLEATAFQNLFETEESKEGLAAFVEKRTPKFRT